MSFLRRIFGRKKSDEGDKSEPDDSAVEGTAESAAESTAESAPSEATEGGSKDSYRGPQFVTPYPEEKVLRHALVEPRFAVDKELVAALRGLVRHGAADVGLSCARALIIQRPDLALLTVAVAEALLQRGEYEVADAQLGRLIAYAESTGASVPHETWMMKGDLAEQRGDRAQALIAYERVLAVDVDYPGARERAARLREEGGPGGTGSRAAVQGATLMADGAMARGRYRIERELGRGGAGSVFLAEDTALGRKVALKVYHRRGAAELKRLSAEARTPAGMEHPGVIRVFDLDLKLCAVTMESLSLGSLKGVIERGGLSVERARTLISSAIDGLQYLHAQGVVHRDVKPSNLLLRSPHQVVWTDFGLAARVAQRLDDAPDVPPEDDAAGEGTLQYMAPEQRLGAPPAPAADVHALGVTLAELAAATIAPPDAWLDLARRAQDADPSRRPSLEAFRAAVTEGSAGV